MKMKLIILGILAASLAVFTSAYGAPDYKKIKKDLAVMAQIVKSAFKEDTDCKRCSLTLTTHYLANQGAVFTVEDSNHDQRHRLPYALHNLEALKEHAGIEALAGLEALENIELGEISQLEGIPDFIGGILLSVGEGLADAGHRLDFDGDGEIHIYQSDQSDLERASRESLRALNRANRDLAFEIREHEIERIHANDEKTREEINQKVSVLRKKIDANNKKRDQARAEVNQAREARKQKILARKDKYMALQRENREKTRAIVLQSFCDYGSTLKHLPDSERVSIIFKQRDEDEIIVLKKSQLEGCQSGEKLVSQKALTYMF